MQNLHLPEHSVKLCDAMITIINAGCDGVHFLVHNVWNNRDDSIAGMYDCVNK